MSIKGLIETHRTQMESAGLLRRAEAQTLSPRVAAMRPSLVKVQAALAERPDQFAVVQPSPMAMLFDYTLPRIENILVDLGEEKAEREIAYLCEYGKNTIENYGVERAREHLEELFKDLPDYEEEIRRGGISGGWIDRAYRELHFGDNGKLYLGLKLKNKITKLEINYDGEISLETKPETNDSDLIIISRVKNLRELDLSGTKVMDAGVEHLEGMVNLQMLDLMWTRVTNVGLIHLKGLVKLWGLGLGETQVMDSGLEHLESLVDLQKLDLRGTQVTNDGLIHLHCLVKLRELDLGLTEVTDDGVEKLKRAIPGLEIIK